MSFRKLFAVLLLTFILDVQMNDFRATPEATDDKMEVSQKDPLMSKENYEVATTDKKEAIDEKTESKSSYNLFFYLIYQFLKKNPLTNSR